LTYKPDIAHIGIRDALLSHHDPEIMTKARDPEQNHDVKEIASA